MCNRYATPRNVDFTQISTGYMVRVVALTRAIDLYTRDCHQGAFAIWTDETRRYPSLPMKALVFSASVCFLTLCLRGSDTIEYVPYNAFLKAIDAGQIERVWLSDLSTIEGQMKTPAGLIRFQANHPIQPGMDPLLVAKLKERGVAFKVSDKSIFNEQRMHLVYSTFDLLWVLVSLVVVLLVVVFLQFGSLRRLVRQSISPPFIQSGPAVPPTGGRRL